MQRHNIISFLRKYGRAEAVIVSLALIFAWSCADLYVHLTIDGMLSFINGVRMSSVPYAVNFIFFGLSVDDWIVFDTALLIFFCITMYAVVITLYAGFIKKGERGCQ